MLFSLSSAVGLYLFKRGNCLKKDSVSALKMLVGDDEMLDLVRLESARHEDFWSDRSARQYTQQPSIGTVIRAKLRQLMIRYNFFSAAIVTHLILD